MFNHSMNNNIMPEIFEDYFDMCAVDLECFPIVLNWICDIKRKYLQ